MSMHPCLHDIFFKVGCIMMPNIDKIGCMYKLTDRFFFLENYIITSLTNSDWFSSFCRDLAEFGMGMNVPPPIMSREEFEARKADLRRKRESERRGER